MRYSILNSRKSRSAIAILALTALCMIVPVGYLEAQAATEPRAQGPELSSGVLEEEAAVSPAPVSQESLTEAQEGSLGLGARAVGALIVVLALIWISMILLKRFMPYRFGPLGHRQRIRVLETVPIGEKRSLTLIRVDHEELLLASTPGSLSLLKEIRRDGNSGPPAQIELEGAAGPQSSSGGTEPTTQRFADTLAHHVRNMGTEPAPGPLARLASLRRKLEARQLP